jgi:hypothetical protein
MLKERRMMTTKPAKLRENQGMMKKDPSTCKVDRAIPHNSLKFRQFRQFRPFRCSHLASQGNEAGKTGGKMPQPLSKHSPFRSRPAPFRIARITADLHNPAAFLPTTR